MLLPKQHLNGLVADEGSLGQISAVLYVRLLNAMFPQLNCIRRAKIKGSVPWKQHSNEMCTFNALFDGSDQITTKCKYTLKDGGLF